MATKKKTPASSTKAALDTAAPQETNTPPNMRLVAKGMDEPRAALAEQAKVSVGLATKHATALDKAGWTAPKTAALHTALGQIEGTVATQADARGTKLLATKAAHTAQSNAKQFIRRLRNVLPIALRETAVIDVNASSFHAGAPLGRSKAKTSAYLTTISKPLAKLDADLAPYFNGKLASAEAAAAAKTALDTADVTHETTLTSLPEGTQAVYQAKGQTLELIEDLNRIAKNAFEGDAVTIAQFNKDIVLRGRHHRAVVEATPVVGTPVAVIPKV